MLTEAELKGIKDGIENGFNNKGLFLSEKDRMIVEVTVQTTIAYLEERKTLLSKTNNNPL